MRPDYPAVRERMSSSIEIGMFECTPEGVRLLARSSDPELIGAVRERLVARLAESGVPTSGPLGVVPTRPAEGVGDS
jgi:hypothetical protein